MILAHRVDGDPEGLPLLMIHPLGADQGFWDECRRHFGPGIKAVSCDLRGSGASPDLSEPLSLATSVADVERLRGHLGLEKIVLIGCAVGGMAAASYAANHADRAHALVISNPGIRVTAAGAENLRQRAATVRRSGMVALLPAAIENAFFGYYDSQMRRQYEAGFIGQKPENYAFATLGAAQSDIAADCRKVGCPVLLVPGDNDRLFRREHTEEIAANIPQAKVKAFAKGAHFIPYQQPVEFAGTVMNFLKETRLAHKL